MSSADNGVVLRHYKTKVCKNCGKEFRAQKDAHLKRRKYCSRACYAEARRGKPRKRGGHVTVFCSNIRCKKPFVVTKSHARGKRYCSIVCNNVGKRLDGLIQAGFISQ